MFSRESLSSVLDYYKKELESEINKMDKTYLSKNKDKLEKEFIENHSIKCPVIDDNKKYIKTDVGNIILVAIPFTGNKLVFELKPSSYQSNPPHGNIEDIEILMEISIKGLNKTQTEKEINQNIENIQKYLSWANVDIKKHNDWIKENTTILIEEKLKEIKAKEEFLDSLNMSRKKG